MANPFTSRGRCLPDHLSPDGDTPVVTLTIRVFASGAMSVEGPLEEREWCLAALENAKSSVRNHRGAGTVIPGVGKRVLL